MMAENALKPVYYFYGSDDYLSECAIEDVKKEALRGGFASMNYHVFEGRSALASEIVAAASTMPAFAEWRVVLVRNAGAIKATEIKELADYVKRPSPTTCLIFHSESPRIEKASPFFKALSDLGCLKACNRMAEKDLHAWIRREVKAQGKGITEGAVRKLADISGGGLRDLKGELDKIVLFSWEKDTIDERDVEDAGLDLKEETAFGLAEAIGEKDPKKALRILSKLSGEEPLKVLGAISRQIRVILRVKALIKKRLGPEAIASAVGVPPYFVDKYIRSSRRFSERELKAAIERLCAADADLKTGRVPEGVVLSNLITGLCSGG